MTKLKSVVHCLYTHVLNSFNIQVCVYSQDNTQSGMCYVNTEYTCLQNVGVSCTCMCGYPNISVHKHFFVCYTRIFVPIVRSTTDVGRKPFIEKVIHIYP